MSRPLGWNPELFPPQAWAFVQRHLPGQNERFVGGEAALAGFWFHHRLVDRVELVVTSQEALERLQSEVASQPRQVLPGFIRYDEVDLMVDHAHVIDASKPVEEEIRADSLEDLAADRLLRLAGGAQGSLLVDLYFLERYRVDLLAAAKGAACKDLGLTLSALAVQLARSRPTRLPEGLLRPVELPDLLSFLESLIERFGMQVRL
ncbi:hypothetical protein DYH09_25345 [bacterium CPR1]|nr:hypothetical protein [bacterium CPR1]